MAIHRTDVRRLITLFIAVRSAFAFCQAPQPRLLCAEYSNSQAVVIAKVVRIEMVGDDDGHRYKLSTIERFRGNIPASFTTWEENSSSRASFDWVPGRSYLLFPNYSPSDHAWIVDGCGNSGPVNKSRASIATIRSFKPEGPALLSGIVTTSSWTTGVPGVTITASGQARTFRAISDRDGRFAFKLPPGIWSFHAAASGEKFDPGPVSYENPRELRLEPGSCAQIQFETANDSN